MHAIRLQESSEEHSTCRQQEGPEAEQWVLVVSKQSDYHRQQDKVLNRDSRAWRLGVKVTSYQDKDEDGVLSKSLES